MLGLREEIASFLTAFLTGMTVACVYLCIRKLRRVIRHSLAAVTVEDALYWIGTAVYIFVQIYHTSSGSIRWYFVIGMLLGLMVFLLLVRLIGKAGNSLYKKRKKKS
ncbi:MAG: spore cortex biosynthesis protein YabQ [Eubacteriales bacterium]|nr:spore cortex biosynthesis protein YabQ [Eubacteriales bacterium]